MKIRYYNILAPHTGENVLGGPVSEDNAYIRAYPRVLAGRKAINALAVGESTLAEYSLSGSKGVYRIVRIDDRSRVEG